jgi:acetyl-CoA acyltransferase
LTCSPRLSRRWSLGTGIDPGIVDDVIIGCVGQNLEQSATPGRQAWLAAGFPEHVPSVTIERKCGSGQQAIEFAAAGIVAGLYDIVIAGGVESMSRVPITSARMGADPHGPGVRARYPGLSSRRGVSAELVAHRWGLSRTTLDTYAVRSHARAAAAAASGGFDDELVAVTPPGAAPVSADESIRPGTTLERLAGLAAVFGTDEMRARFPRHRLVGDGGQLLADHRRRECSAADERGARRGVRPAPRGPGSMHLPSSATTRNSCSPAPIAATTKVLARAGLTLRDIDTVEVNEAFASVPLAWLAEHPYDEERLNPRGGAIALGHPLGASGARIMTSMLHHLEQTGGRYGLQTICEAGGMANATILERLG